jgi:hypothetical protein
MVTLQISLRFFFRITHNVPLTDAVAAVELSFFNFRKNENRKIKSQTTENQRLRLSAVVGRLRSRVVSIFRERS